MKQKLLTLLLITFIPIAMMAYECKVDGIYYNLNTSDNTASVTYYSTDYNSYSGSITIPSSFVYNGTTYRVTSIGDYAFRGCTELTSITIPSSVTSIEYCGIYRCPKLTSITIPSSVTSLGECAFSYSGLTSITIPSSVTSIGSYAFYDCTDLASITFPSSVTSIGHHLFSGCSSLPVEDNLRYADTYLVEAVDKTQSTYTIKPGTRYIGYAAFNDCSNLTSITIPEGVTSIGEAAFSGCILNSVTIPTSVTSIGEQAFSYVYSVTVENPTPITISSNVFSHSPGAKLYVPLGSKSAYLAADYWKEFIIIEYPIEQTLSLTKIPSKTYGDAAYTLPEKTTEGLTITWTSSNTNVAVVSGNTLTIKNVGTAIITATQTGNNFYKPFSTTYTLTVNKAPLTVTAKSYTITQGDPLPTFEATYSGFKNNETASVLTTQPTFSCSATSSSAPGTYTITPSGATATNYSFTYVNGTLTIESPADPIITFADADVKALCVANWDTNGDGELSEAEAAAVTDLGTVFGENNSIVSFEELQYFTGLTSIGEWAFAWCSSLSSITIPSSVTTIGFQAFDSSNLTSITIPSSVTSMDGNPFSGCYNLTSITVDAGNTKYDSRNKCNAIIETSSNKLIVGCNNTVIPSNVTSLGDHSFEGFDNLSSITIPENIVSIGNYAFSCCYGLTSIDIPTSVTSIGCFAFWGCEMTSITIPSSVTSIGEGAFHECESLNTVICEATIPPSFLPDLSDEFSSGDIIMFSGHVYSEATLYVPATSIDAYRSTDGWKNFEKISPIEDIINPSGGETNSDNYIVMHTNTTGGNSYCVGILEGDFFLSDYEDAPERYESHVIKVIIDNEEFPYQGYHLSDYGYDTSVEHTIVVYYDSPMTDIYRMFTNTFNVDYLDMSHFDASHVENMENLITGAASLDTWVLPANLDITLCEKKPVTSIDNTALAHVYCPSNRLEDYKSYFLNMIDEAHTLNSARKTNRVYNCLVANDSYYESPSYPFITFADANVKALCVENWDTNGDGELSEAEAAAVTDLGSVFQYNDNITSFDELQYFTGLTALDDGNFIGCSSLTSITIPINVTCLNMGTFGGCTSLTSITILSSTLDIGECVFSGCTSLTSITIPSNVTYIWGSAFSYCSNLTSITVDADNTVYDSRDNCNAIIETASNSLVVGCQNTIIPSNVTTIRPYAFCGCSNLTSIDIPNSIKYIMDLAFSECDNLTSITIGNSISKISSCAFSNSGALTSVTIENPTPPVFGINFSDPYFIINDFFNPVEDSFMGCEAFPNCENATLYVPLGSKSAYETAVVWRDFKNIIEIGTSSPIITFADANVKALCVENWDTNGDGELSEAEAAAVTDLGSVFQYNDNITSFDELQYFTGLTSIDYDAFYDCSGLTSITIPSSVTNIECDAFSGCSGLPVEDNLRYADTYLVEAVDKTKTTYTIKPGTRIIGCKAFCSCSGLTSIDIPEGVTSIGERAFAWCSRLSSITIGNSVTSIGSSAFSGCPNLSSITVSSDNSIYDSRDNCNAIIETSSNTLIAGCKNSIIPNSVTSIGSEAFYESYNLTAIDIPESVTSIGHFAFGLCTDLISIHIPNSVTSIGEAAFTCCSSLIAADIPEGVTSIESITFSHCFSLTTVTIPSSVSSIGEMAFYGCDSLTSVTVENPTPVTITSDVFSNRTNATLYVPYGSKSAYQGADYWKEFNIVETEEPASLRNTLSGVIPTLHTSKNATLSINLNNEDELMAFDFYMQLPEGISIALDEDGYPDATLNEERSNRHILEVEQTSDGRYHFICYSSLNNAFKGNNGELLSINLVCENNMESGIYHALLNNIKFRDINEALITLPDLSFDFEVTNVTKGDANGDGVIDVVDIVAIVNYILGRPSDNFNFEAADLDGDGQLDLIDVVKAVRMIMDQPAPMSD